MAFKRNNQPWNKGKRGLEAGWTPERRQRQSEKQKQWIRDNPHNPFWGEGGPDRWLTGPDPEVRRHRYRWLRARAQARFWGQEWTITWEDYLDLFKTAPGRWGRGMTQLNLTREDTRRGWHIWNVRLRTRSEAMRRPTGGHRRIRPKGLGTRPRNQTKNNKEQQ